MTEQLEIISLNCWGLKFISKLTDERIAHIASRLATCDADIVCLQEVWQERHWQHIRAAVHHNLPHAKYYWSGMMGSGLAILSRFPIVETDMRPYTINGRPQAFWRGDWYVGKGVASAIVALPDGQQCQIFNTHMHAPYNETVDTYLCHRTAQGWDFRKMLRASVQAGYITFATGDFNSIPGSLVHRFLTTYLSDSFITLHPDLPLLPQEQDNLAATELVSMYGMTCDVSPINTWRAEQAPGMHAKRLDYVFHDHRVQPVSVDVIFTEPVSVINCSPSDHFGLRCTYKFKKEPSKGIYRGLHYKDYDEMLDMLDAYKTRELTHSRRRIIHFWISLLSIFFAFRWHFRHQSRFVHICSSLVILLSATAAVIQGLLAVVFGWWELRSLWEFEDEIHRAKALHVH